MRKGPGLIVLLVVLVLTVAGCGGSEEAAPGQTATTATIPSAAPTTATPATGEWQTVTTLRSSDPQTFTGVLVSEKFAAAGDVRLVLDMPDGGMGDGVIGAVIPADKAGSLSDILDAVLEGTAVTMIPSAPVKELADLEGTFVLINSVPTEKAWSLAIQTKVVAP